MIFKLKIMKKKSPTVQLIPSCLSSSIA